MTASDLELEARIEQVLTVGSSALPVGHTVPPFPSSDAQRTSAPRRRVSRKIALIGAVLSVAVGGTAAAAAIHLSSAPVTRTDLARCYSVDSLAGGANFAGTSVAAAGVIGTHTQVTNAIAACTTIWKAGLLTLGSTRVGGTRPPAGNLSYNHPVPPLTVCVLPGGIAGVFPGAEATCQKLGLPGATGYHVNG